MVRPVANSLTEMGVPFIYCTGYDRLSPETNFADVPILGSE